MIEGLTEDAVKRLASLKTEIEQRFVRVDTRLDAMDAHLDRVDTRLDQMETWLGRVDTDMDRMENMLSQILARLSEKP